MPYLEVLPSPALEVQTEEAKAKCGPVQENKRKWPKTIGKIRTAPKPNLPGPEYILVLHLHSDSALFASGEHPGLMCGRCWVTWSPREAPRTKSWAPPEAALFTRGPMWPSELLFLLLLRWGGEEKADPGGTCPICFSARGCAGHYHSPWFPGPSKASVLPASSMHNLQAPKVIKDLYCSCFHCPERLTRMRGVCGAVTPYNNSLPTLGPLCHRGERQLPSAMGLPQLGTRPSTLVLCFCSLGMAGTAPAQTNFRWELFP